MDESEQRDANETKIQCETVGKLQWAVAQGRFYIMCAAVTMTTFWPASRQGGLEHIKHINCYIHNYKETAIKFKARMPGYTSYQILKEILGKLYNPCQDDIPCDAPEQKGKSVQISSFVDANIISNVVTGRSWTGILHLIDKTPIEYFSKSQTSVETATYGRLMKQTGLIYTGVLKRRYL